MIKNKSKDFSYLRAFKFLFKFEYFITRPFCKCLFPLLSFSYIFDNFFFCTCAVTWITKGEIECSFAVRQRYVTILWVGRLYFLELYSIFHVLTWSSSCYTFSLMIFALLPRIVPKLLMDFVNLACWSLWGKFSE